LKVFLNISLVFKLRILFFSSFYKLRLLYQSFHGEWLTPS